MKAEQEAGFSLIELMTVVSIVGVLATIAISQYNSFQARAFNARAEHDLRTAITAEEAYFSDYEAYTACNASNCQNLLDGFVASDGVLVTITTLLADSVFQVTAVHPKGDRAFAFDSETGVFASRAQ